MFKRPLWEGGYSSHIIAVNSTIKVPVTFLRLVIFMRWYNWSRLHETNLSHNFCITDNNSYWNLETLLWSSEVHLSSKRSISFINWFQVTKLLLYCKHLHPFYLCFNQTLLKTLNLNSLSTRLKNEICILEREAKLEVMSIIFSTQSKQCLWIL